MKVKTSITLEKETLRAIDKKSGSYGSRSGFIETAAKNMLKQLDKETEEQRDLEIINSRADELNAEADDVLSFQEL